MSVVPAWKIHSTDALWIQLCPGCSTAQHTRNLLPVPQTFDSFSFCIPSSYALPFSSPLTTPSLIPSPSASLCVSKAKRERERPAFCWLCIMRQRARLRKEREGCESEH